jgi:glycosyltransferase involved in cell wall biosynthesis
VRDLDRIGVFLSVDPRNTGGLESYTATLCNGLQSRGYRVLLNGEPIERLHDISEIWNARIRKLLPLMTRPTLSWLAIGAANLWGKKWSDRVVRDCDQVHFIGTGWNLIGFPLLKSCQKMGVPISCWPAIHPGQWGDSPLDKSFYRNLNKIFSQSEYEKRILSSFGITEDRLVTVGCAPTIDTVGNGFGFIDKYDIERRFKILFLGRKDSAKGYAELRRAVARLIERYPQVLLISIGKSFNIEEVLLPKTHDLDLGITDDQTKQNALAACDVLCVPSSSESFGIVYTEAWAYGKPVICGSSPASQELIRRHVGGLVTDGGACEISAAIEHFVLHPDSRKAMGDSGRQAQKRFYNSEYLVEKHVEAWRIASSTKHSAKYL